MRSFTLIETLIVIAVFSLSIGALTGLIAMAYRTYSFSEQQSMAIEEARRGIEIIIKEIREARSGENGSYAIEKAGDKEFIFYSDIDNDGKTERVRYFLGSVNFGSQTKECVTSLTGGSCSVTFSDFFQGTLQSATLKVSVDGDLDRDVGLSNPEYVTIFADGSNLDDICQTGCLHCAGFWQGTSTFDVTSQASDNSIQFLADASPKVGYECPVGSPNHSMKARFELSFLAELSGAEHELKKGVIEPTGSPVQYPADQEEISIISSYVRNAPPIFEYLDSNGNQITEYPARLTDTKVMDVLLIINVNPNRPPQDFELESSVQLRNLKD